MGTMHITTALFVCVTILLPLHGFPDTKVVPREGYIKLYPCSRCHEHKKELSHKKKFTKKDFEGMKKHTDLIYKHMAEVTNCFLCHDRENPDRLVMLDGVVQSYNNATGLCGQCHGLRLKKWKENMHGFQSGGWNLEQKKYACTHCHEPHNPKFKPMESRPPPHKPTLHKNGGH